MLSSCWDVGFFSFIAQYYNYCFLSWNNLFCYTRAVYYFVSQSLASLCNDRKKVTLAWKTTKENEPVNPQLCKHPSWLCKKFMFLTFKALCFDTISTLCLCSKLHGFLKTDFSVALKIRVTSRKTNASCSVVDSQLRVWRARCVEVNLAAGGSPVGWQMEGKRLFLTGAPGLRPSPRRTGGREVPGAGIGEGDTGGGAGPAPARLWPFVLFAVPAFSRCISGCLLGRAWEWCIAVP